MYENLPAELEQRLRAASHALPVEDTLREVADAVLSMDQDGSTGKEVDAYIDEWMDANGFGFEEFCRDFSRDAEGTLLEGLLDMRKLWDAYGVEDWFKLDGGSIASYQLKRPFECLRRDPKGAFYHPWWAIQDLNL